MDLLKEIRDRVDVLPETEKPGCLDVLRHLEHCDRLLVDGRNGTHEFFNDIVYRTNQAFEGALREAYRTLQERDPDSATLFKIEAAFVKSALVRPKVVNLMTNYRKEWRNPSTHDYRLKFDESEAILAIASVSAFFLTLLGQINDKLAIKEAEEAAKHAVRHVARKNDDLQRAIIDIVKSVLPSILLSQKSDLTGRQAELLFAQAIVNASPSWKVTREPAKQLTSGAVAGVDLLVSNGMESVAVEIKRLGAGRQAAMERIGVAETMWRFMSAAGISKGVFVCIPRSKDLTSSAHPIVERKLPLVIIDPSVSEPNLVEVGFAYDLDAKS